MARSAEDCALLLNVMAGFDERDSTSLERDVEDYTRDLEQPLAGLRIGLPKEFFGEGLAADVARAVEAAIAEYRKLGARRSRSACPTPAFPCRPTTCWLRPKPPPTCRASTACVTAPCPRIQGSLGHVRKDAGRGLRRRSQAPHHDRYLCAVARLLRRLLSPGAENPPPDRQRFQRSLQVVRRHLGSDGAHRRVRFWRKGIRPGGHVSVGHLHHRRQSCRTARHVDSLRIHHQQPSDRPAVDRRLFRRIADC